VTDGPFFVYPVPAYKFERIDRNDSALLIIDHQVGLLGAVRDYNAQDMYNNVIFHATLGKTYNLPVVITTSAEQGCFLARDLSDRTTP
jgi:hypothetical protein